MKLNGPLSDSQLARDKRLNTPEFNIKAKKRRKKANFDAKGRKINQKVARRKR